MMLMHEILCQQLRQIQNWRTSAESVWSCRHRWLSEREPAGQELQHSCCSEVTIVAKPTVQPRDSTCIVPLLHLWMRLNDISTISRLRSLHRLRLQQRSLWHNLGQVVALHWNSFRGKVYATPSTPSAVADAATQTVKSFRMKLPNVLRKMFKYFKMISKKLESALSIHMGGRPCYMNTSAAMEVLSISAISQLNSVLIDYLINNDEYMSAHSLVLLDIL
ncbi:uncharacterized protein LOC6567705 isoform X2 [Drosophila grimshawi]|uniref:uncharacterized protein LOC6567705 isoform X2 n=1 Tax=Drosophila grimshawi TaxID=7222 RepID=UPI000C86EE5E|nr:uncharacterized protein LOC6567705 isoform X2 [Drosophila grimshawi]